MKNPTREAAMNAWYSAAASDQANETTDSMVNELLDDIAGNRSYSLAYYDDDPIYTIIGNLTASEQRRFIKEANKILNEHGRRAY